MKQREIIIVGGGASGLVAAISAARRQAKVTILEQKDRVGKKILSTGNGKCNLTNEYMTPSCYRSDEPEIVESVLAHFGYQNTIAFFEELGICMKNRQGYIYPISEQATAILDVLRMEVEHLGVTVFTEQTVKSVTKKGDRFHVQTQNRRFPCDALILATGGKAAPALGSDGSGYSLAKSFGHRLTTVVPALVQLQCEGKEYKQLAGIRTQAKVTLYENDTFLAEEQGELQLTNYGISGIPVFQVSRYAAKALAKRQTVTACIDFLPSFTKEAFYNHLKARRQTQGYKTGEDFLIGLFPKKMIPVFLKKAGISFAVPAKDWNEKDLERLINVCKEYKTTVTKTNDFTHAQVCAGGVRTEEVVADTLESKLVEGLYLVGELLDVDGICGGYNLQWAWATGCLAGQAAARG